MLNLPVIIIIILAVALNSAGAIAGFFLTPQGFVFLGRVHHPLDYFYYLSQFAQGKTNWLANYNLYSNDGVESSIVGWINIFIGHLFSLIGVSHLLTYQITIVLASLLFLSLSYKFIAQFFLHSPQKNKLSIIALFIFVSSNAFPTIQLTNGKWNLSYFNYWFNYGSPFTRLGGVPHQIIGHAASLAIYLLTIQWILKTPKSVTLLKTLSLVVLGLISASASPIQWLMTIAILSISLSFYLFKQKLLSDKISRLKLIIRSFFPLILTLLAGVPVAIYYQKLFKLIPFVLMSYWEAWNQVYIPFSLFVLSTGPVIILASIGIYLSYKKISLPWLISLVGIILPVFLFFSRLPAKVLLQNSRFLSPLVILFLSCFTAQTIVYLGNKIKLKTKETTIVIVLFFLFLTAPATIFQLKEKIIYNVNDSFNYLPINDVKLFQKAKEISTTKDTFLIIWPFNISFPALTARRSYHGHSLLTVYSPEKDKAVDEFFNGKMDQNQREEFLKSKRINFIITYSDNPKIKTLTSIVPISANSRLTLYQVKK